MHIGIDGNEANIKNRVGVNKYAFEVLWGIYKLLPKNPDLIVTVYLKQKPLVDLPSSNKQFKYKILSGGKVWILSKLTPYLLFTKEKPDVFFAPSHYLPPIITMPGVCAIMDLGYLEFSGQFTRYDFWQLKYWSAWSIKVSKVVLTISDATRKDIVRHYPESKEKVVVAYPGYDEYLTTKSISDTAVSTVKKKYSIVNDYILYLGTLKPSKNIEGLINAFYKVKNRENLQLVIAGKKGWLYDSIFAEVNKLGMEKEVVFTDFLPEEDKYPLIKGAKAFILPSFWEGFGIDILSAFALGVPVLASNVGSLPEVVGNAGILVDPKDPDAIANGIEKILSMGKTDYNILVEKEKKQLAKFSWEKVAQIAIETFRKVAK